MRALAIDVSHNDAGIDMQRWVRERGVWGVIVKAGGYEVIDAAKGYPEQFENSWYKRHGDNATALGTHLGAYYFTVAKDTDTARTNADHFCALLDKYGYRFDMPVYADIEDVGQLGIGRRRLTDVIVAFIERVNSHGYTCGLYTGRCALHESMIPEELERYPLWIAEYSNACHTSVEHGMWQFGCMSVDGDVYLGDRAGYVDANWCYVDYPSIITGGGGRLPAVPKLSYALAAAEVMDHFVDHDAHGYSQPNRDGVGYESLELSDGTVVEFNGGDRDCSRLIQTCYVVVGVLPRGIHMWTGTEREILLANGFVEVSLGDLQRGDVLMRQGHTEMYMGDGVEAGARRSEHGTIDGATGDQDGGEITRSAFVRSHWTSAYRCVRKRPGEGATAPVEATTPVEKKDDTAQTGEEMICLIHPDDENCMYYFDGSRLRPLSHQDEQRAIEEVYAATHGGAKIPMVKLGTAKAPLGARLKAVLAR